MGKAGKLLLSLLAVLALAGSSQAWTLNFEGGTDGATIASGIPGLQFTTTAGYDWVYGVHSSGNYNTTSSTLGGIGSYYVDQDVFAWLGIDQGYGRIDFLNQDGSTFTTGYSSYATMYLEAYDAGGNLLDAVSGASNLNTNTLGYLTVNSASNNIAYVLIHDTGNYWLADNMSGDATGVPDQGGPQVPEPTTVLLMGLGIIGTGMIRKIRM